MSKLIKVAMIFAVASVAIGAKQMMSPTVDASAEAQLVAPAASVPMKIMTNAGPLPETEVSSYF